MISIPGSNEWHWNVNGQGKHLLFCKIIIQPNNYFHDSFWLIGKGHTEAQNCLTDPNSSSTAPQQGRPLRGNGSKAVPILIWAGWFTGTCLHFLLYFHWQKNYNLVGATVESPCFQVVVLKADQCCKSPKRPFCPHHTVPADTVWRTG